MIILINMYMMVQKLLDKIKNKLKNDIFVNRLYNIFIILFFANRFFMYIFPEWDALALIGIVLVFIVFTFAAHLSNKDKFVYNGKKLVIVLMTIDIFLSILIKRY